MTIITPMLALPTPIQAGLASSAYTRFGGTIRETGTGRIVALLRDTGPAISSQTLALLQIGSAASVLNLGITTIGFAVVLKRLDELERRLQLAQKILHHIDAKLDITFYGNVRAALDLATNALILANTKNREVSALQAINRLTEARYHYTALVDLHLEMQSQVVDEYLATLTLAYVAEARCYLELEEADAAQRIIEQGTIEVGTRARQHVQILLTSNPAAYLHPKLRGTIDLVVHHRDYDG
jgi:predicted ATP-dependent endonuclease of OLD family